MEVQTIPSVIAAKDVTKRFKRVTALSNVSLEIPPGEIYGLLGRNGAGKTTLVKIFLDLARANSGKTYLMHRSSRSASARRSVGYLPEDHRFPGYQTGMGSLRFYAALSGRRCSKKRFQELIDLVGLSKAAGRKIRTYSKGMKQRLGLAQALIAEPDVLFLDEPTDGVDPVGRAQIRDLLLKLKAENKTIFLNSHLLGEVEQVCDRIGILDQGCLLREGTLDELTQVEKVVLLKTVPELDEHALEELRSKVLSAGKTDKGIEVKLASEADIDGVVDFLRARRISIRSMNNLRLTLEDVFLGLVTNGGEERW